MRSTVAGSVDGLLGLGITILNVVPGLGVLVVGEFVGHGDVSISLDAGVTAIDYVTTEKGGDSTACYSASPHGEGGERGGQSVV